MTKSPTIWTNQSLRAHLGVHGFLAQDDTLKKEGRFYTVYMRGNDELVLIEFVNGAAPLLMQDGVEVDPVVLGYRNSQIQNDKRYD